MFVFTLLVKRNHRKSRHRGRGSRFQVSPHDLKGGLVDARRTWKNDVIRSYEPTTYQSCFHVSLPWIVFNPVPQRRQWWQGIPPWTSYEGKGLGRYDLQLNRQMWWNTSCCFDCWQKKLLNEQNVFPPQFCWANLQSVNDVFLDESSSPARFAEDYLTSCPRQAVSRHQLAHHSIPRDFPHHLALTLSPVLHGPDWGLKQYIMVHYKIT